MQKGITKPLLFERKALGKEKVNKMALDYFQQKRGEKGITPVVAIILLLLVTISIVGFAMIFFQRIAAQSGEAGETQLQQRISSAGTQPKIISVSGNKIYVQNAGTSNLEKSGLNFYADNELKSVTSATIDPLPPGQTGEYTINEVGPATTVRVTSGGLEDKFIMSNSCKSLLASGKTSSGVYNINPDGSGDIAVYCDMSADGGGWTLMLKTAQNDPALQYTASYWSTAATLNPNDLTLTAASAKYEAFNKLPFKQIRGCVTTPTSNCVYHTFSTARASALALFNGPETYEGVVRDEFYGIFKPSGMKDCPAQRAGFNVKANDNNWYRWGFANNIPSQACQPGNTDDADGAIGWGIQGQDCGATGAGWTNYFVSDSACSGNHKSFNSWIWVK